MGSLDTIDLLAIAVYFAGVAAIGLRAGRRSRSTESYFLGSRNLPGWAVGLSLVGTSISSVSFLAFPADAFKTAWLRMVPNLVLPVGVLAASWFFLGFYRNGRTTTAFEYLEARFGPSTRVYGAFAFIVGQVLRVSLILFLVGELLHELTGLSPEASILLAGAFVCLYTVAGGLEAVVWTDVAQTLVLSLGGIACLSVVAWEVPGGLPEVFASAWSSGKLGFSELMPDGSLRPAGLSFSLTDKTLSMMVLVGLSHWLAEYGCNQNVVQRYCAASSTREARKALWVACWSAIPLWTCFMFLGSALWVFYQHFPTETASGILAGEIRAERIMPHFVLNELPMGLTGLVVAGVLAAAMSSLDSSLNAISTVSVVDVYRRHLACERPDAHYLRVARGFSMLGSIAMVAGALLLLRAETKTLQDTATTLIALTSGGLLGLYLLGFLTRRGDGRGVAFAILATLAFSLYRASADASWFPASLRLPGLDAVDGYYTAILAHILMFGVGYVATLALPRRTPLDPALTARGTRGTRGTQAS